MENFDAGAPALRRWKDLVGLFSKEGETIGFVVCIDELSNICDENEKEYRRLLNTLLAYGQYTISEGGYFAVVGSSLHIYDLGEHVLQRSGRALQLVKFSTNPDMIMEKTKQIVQHAPVIASSSDARLSKAHFSLEVALQVARTSPRVSYWLDVAQSQNKVEIPQISYGIPAILTRTTCFSW